MAELIFINDDVSADSLLDLYKNSDAMVLPSRGEGFNLPAAEAIAAGLKLIVTGYGGHMDYCYPGSARFIKYRFERSQYQVTDGESLWAEPELDDLCAGLKEVMEGSFEVRQEAREKTLAALRSERWIARIEDAVNSLVNMCFE